MTKKVFAAQEISTVLWAAFFLLFRAIILPHGSR
jgi:hypothetical protein